MSKVIQVNQQQFESEVLRSKLPVIVDFYASWCPPCRALAPILDRLAEEFDGEIKFVKIDSDEEPSLADDYDVTALPTLILIEEEGRNQGRFQGPRNETEIREHLQKWIASRKAATQ